MHVRQTSPWTCLSMTLVRYHYSHADACWCDDTRAVHHYRLPTCRSARNAESAAFGAPLRVGSGSASAGPAASPTDVAAGGSSPQAEAADAPAGASQADALQPAAIAMPRRVTRAAARAADSAGGAAEVPAPADSPRPAAAALDDAQQPQQSQPAASLVTTTRRGCAYDLWQLGRYRVVVRAHEAAVLRDPARPPLLARAKLEYMPKFSLEAVRRVGFRVPAPWNHKFQT